MNRRDFLKIPPALFAVSTLSPSSLVPATPVLAPPVRNTLGPMLSGEVTMSGSPMLDIMVGDIISISNGLRDSSLFRVTSAVKEVGGNGEWTRMKMKMEPVRRENDVRNQPRS